MDRSFPMDGGGTPDPSAFNYLAGLPSVNNGMFSPAVGNAFDGLDLSAYGLPHGAGSAMFSPATPNGLAQAMQLRNPMLSASGMATPGLTGSFLPQINLPHDLGVS